MFMLHATKLYVKLADQRDLQIVDCDVTNLVYLSDDSFFYMTSEVQLIQGLTVEHSRIFMVQTRFGAFDKLMLYKDRDPLAEILNFGVDSSTRRLLILTGKKNMKQRRDKFITIFDIDTEQIVFRSQIQDIELIGRLKSNLYNFVHGHIYYGSKVIKIRYDLIQKNQEQTSQAVFKHYADILCLSQDDHVQSGMPLTSCQYNRLAFIIHNS